MKLHLPKRAATVHFSLLDLAHQHRKAVGLEAEDFF